MFNSTVKIIINFNLFTSYILSIIYNKFSTQSIQRRRRKKRINGRQNTNFDILALLALFPEWDMKFYLTSLK